MNSSVKKIHLHLRTLFVIATIALSLLTAWGMTYVTHKLGTRSLTTLWMLLAEQISDTMTEKALRYFIPTIDVARLTNEKVKNHTLPSEKIPAYTQAALAAYPQFNHFRLLDHHLFDQPIPADGTWIDRPNLFGFAWKDPEERVWLIDFNTHEISLFLISLLDFHGEAIALHTEQGTFIAGTNRPVDSPPPSVIFREKLL